MNFTERQRQIAERAIIVWGDRQQIIKAIEEMSELTQALSKWLNIGTQIRNNTLTTETILNSVDEELADVSIMLMQLQAIFGDGQLPGLIEKKLLRLEQYLPARTEEVREDG